jgi:hypothetical protein
MQRYSSSAQCLPPRLHDTSRATIARSMLQDVMKTPLSVNKIALRAHTATMAHTSVTLLLQLSQSIFLHLLCFFLVTSPMSYRSYGSMYHGRYGGGTTWKLAVPPFASEAIHLHTRQQRKHDKHWPETMIVSCKNTTWKLRAHLFSQPAEPNREVC